MKVSLIITVMVLVAVTKALPSGLSKIRDIDEEWQMYKVMHSKTYSGMEEYSRRLIWQENLKYIQDHNVRYDLGQHTYFLGVNEFTDMTHEEFKAKYLGFAKQRPVRKNSIAFMAPENIGELATSVDWRDEHVVTPVKKQGNCQSYWAFTATGSIEGQYARKTGHLVSLSEQQLVDCSSAYGNKGCDGGQVDNAFNYIHDYGLETEEDYEYTGEIATCQYNASNVVTKVTGHQDIFPGSEDALKTAVAIEGPVAVAIHAYDQNFVFYKGGVYNNPTCSSTDLDHGVLVVGYGSLDNSDYWLVKNSWGTKWGNSGYAFMSRDKNNQCGIASDASYPIICNRDRL